MTRFTRIASLTVAAYTALTLALPAHAQTSDPRIAAAVTASMAQADPLPVGCHLTGHTSEGFPVATCASGETIYADMDGAGGYNSGLPYITPGTWRAIS